MKPITPNQTKAFHAILREKGLADEKAAIVSKLSNGRASSTKDLFYEEVQPWIIAMNSQKKEQADPKERMIRNIIAMAREMGVIVRLPKVQPGGAIKMQSDYTQFNEWMLTKSTGKKALNDYTYQELPKLVSQYRAIYLSWLKRNK